MYKIGEFSKLTQTTTKTLRYYDEENILVPSYRDSINGYRYYDDNDYETALFILELKELGFTISEIKDILSICKNKEDISYIFEEKRNKIRNQINELEITLNKLNNYEVCKNSEEIKSEYQIEYKAIPSITVATLRFKGRYDDVGHYFNEIYKEVKNNTNGYPFCIYYDNEYKDVADIEVCVPIKKMIKSDKIIIKEIPSINAITTIHKGDYKKISNAYKEIFNYVNINHIHISFPHREIYVKGPGMLFKGNINKYITEIILPIDKEK